MDLLAFLRQLTGSDRPSRKGKQSSGQRLNFREACELLGKAPSTLYRWLNEGRIPFYRVGREYQFDRDELLLVGKHELSGKQKVAVKLDPLRIEKAKPKTKKEQDVRYRKLLGLG
jgi:excisionase family DNA binding protein